MNNLLMNKNCIGKNVKIKDYVEDIYIETFGPEGDNDWWNRSESEKQKKYIGKIGKISDWIHCNGNWFIIVDFSNGVQFTFDTFHVELTEEDISVISEQPTKYSSLTNEQRVLAEKLLIAKLTGKDVMHDTPVLRDMVIECIELSIIFSYNTHAQSKWNQSEIISNSERFLQ